MKFRPASSIDTDSPDWRWGQACFETDKESKGEHDYEPSDDLYVGILRKYLRLSRGSTPSDRIRMLMPDLSFLVDLYSSSGYACPRHSLEALMIAGADAAFISRNISTRLTGEMITLYTRMFFSLDGRFESPMWFERHVIAPSRQLPDDDEWFSGFGWKILAFYGGMDKLLTFGMRSRREMTRDDLHWIKNFAISQHRTGLLNYIYKRGTVGRQQGNEDITGRLLLNWEAAETKIEEGARTMADDALPMQVQSAMKRMVAIREPGAKQDKIETIDVAKYTSTEEPKT